MPKPTKGCSAREEEEEEEEEVRRHTYIKTRDMYCPVL
jgi:hypothetical protein